MALKTGGFDINVMPTAADGGQNLGQGLDYGKILRNSKAAQELFVAQRQMAAKQAQFEAENAAEIEKANAIKANIAKQEAARTGTLEGTATITGNSAKKSTDTLESGTLAENEKNRANTTLSTGTIATQNPKNIALINNQGVLADTASEDILTNSKNSKAKGILADYDAQKAAAEGTANAAIANRKAGQAEMVNEASGYTPVVQPTRGALADAVVPTGVTAIHGPKGALQDVTLGFTRPAAANAAGGASTVLANAVLPTQGSRFVTNKNLVADSLKNTVTNPVTGELEEKVWVKTIPSLDENRNQIKDPETDEPQYIDVKMKGNNEVSRQKAASKYTETPGASPKDEYHVIGPEKAIKEGVPTQVNNWKYNLSPKDVAAERSANEARKTRVMADLDKTTQGNANTIQAIERLKNLNNLNVTGANAISSGLLKGLSGNKYTGSLAKYADSEINPKAIEFRSIVQGMIGGVRQVGSGNTSNIEYKSYESTLPSEDYSKEVNAEMLKGMDRVAKMIADKRNFFVRYNDTYKNINGAQPAWDEYVASQPIIVDGKLNSNFVDSKTYFAQKAKDEAVAAIKKKRGIE